MDSSKKVRQRYEPVQAHKKIGAMEEYTLKFGRFQFFDDYVISTINEGVDLVSERLLEFHSLCFEVFQNKPFSIVERKDCSYSLDPSFYIKYRDSLTNIRAHAVVIRPDSSAKLAEYESLYITHCPCSVFNSTSDALDWINQV